VLQDLFPQTTAILTIYVDCLYYFTVYYFLSILRPGIRQYMRIIDRTAQLDAVRGLNHVAHHRPGK